MKKIFLCLALIIDCYFVTHAQETMDTPSNPCDNVKIKKDKDAFDNSITYSTTGVWFKYGIQMNGLANKKFKLIKENGQYKIEWDAPSSGSGTIEPGAKLIFKLADSSTIEIISPHGDNGYLTPATEHTDPYWVSQAIYVLTDNDIKKLSIANIIAFRIFRIDGYTSEAIKPKFADNIKHTLNCFISNTP